MYRTDNLSFTVGSFRKRFMLNGWVLFIQTIISCKSLHDHNNYIDDKNITCQKIKCHKTENSFCFCNRDFPRIG